MPDRSRTPLLHSRSRPRSRRTDSRPRSRSSQEGSRSRSRRRARQSERIEDIVADTARIMADTAALRADSAELRRRTAENQDDAQLYRLENAALTAAAQALEALIVVAEQSGRPHRMGAISTRVAATARAMMYDGPPPAPHPPQHGFE